MIESAPSSASDGVKRCWCGGSQFDPSLHESYLICRQCGNAAYVGVLTAASAEPSPNLDELYSEAYWDSEQSSRGNPTLENRSRIDLPDRCAYWLRYLLPYVKPPARVLEVGSSHGGFLKLLSMAGFEPTGMEINQRIVDESSQRFGVRTLRGTVEENESSLRMFSAVIMMDVVEHLVSPVQTLQVIVNHLEPDGILMIQMPEFKPEYPAEWQMYLPREHTFLHTRASATRLCAAGGLHHVIFEPAIYPWHDMFLIASRSPIKRRTLNEIEADLLERPDSRVVLALLDACAAARTLHDGNIGLKASVKALRRALAVLIRRKLLRG